MEESKKEETERSDKHEHKNENMLFNLGSVI